MRNQTRDLVLNIKDINQKKRESSRHTNPLEPVYEFKDNKNNAKTVLNKIDVKKKSFSNLNNKIDYSLKIDDIEIGKRMFLCPNLKREPKEIHDPNNKDVEVQKIKSFQTKRRTNPLQP